jgi:hypothetical protein
MDAVENIDLSCIRLISFPNFLELKQFPRYPNNRALTISLTDLTDEDYSNSLIVFVSHCWLRGWAGAEGFEEGPYPKKPHPDDSKGSKYALCCDGIEKILKFLAPGMTNCYIWLDYGCIDQDGNPAGELKLLDKIVEVCDCIFTPVYDKNHQDWSLPSLISNLFDEYRSPHWNDNAYSYLNRGWCRIEMFFAANIPSSLKDSEQRKSKFSAGLAYAKTQNRRPHILYGSKEYSNQVPPYILPPLQNIWFEKYHPSQGNLSVESDREKINFLVEQLKPLMKPITIGYTGDRNELGEPNGVGQFQLDSGNHYEGDWKNNKKHGKGKFLWSNGNSYVGNWVNDCRSGHGIYYFANGDHYEGSFKNDLFHGNGKEVLSTGDIYEGEYKNGHRSGAQG